MAADFGKILGKIEDENTALREAQARLQKAYVKLDGKLTRLKAKARIEPYVVDKKTGLQIGYRRIEAQYCITTIRVGLGGTEAEIPVSEASPEAQADLMAYVAPLLDQVLKAVSENTKAATTAATTADKLISAIAT